MPEDPHDRKIELLASSDGGIVAGRNMFTENRIAVILAVPKELNEDEIRAQLGDVVAGAMTR